MPAPIVLLEFEDEARQWLRAASPPDQAHIVALNPRVRAALRRRGIDAASTLPYFPPEAHARVLEASARITEWVRGQFQHADSNGVNAAYLEALVWYTRWAVHHCLWAIELVSNILADHHPGRLLAPIPASGPAKGHYIGAPERYVGLLAREVAHREGVAFTPIVLRVRGEGGWWRRAGRAVAWRTLPRAGAAVHLRDLRGRFPRPILLTTRAYRMEAVAQRLRAEHVPRPLLVLEEWGSRPVRSILGRHAAPPFDREVPLAILDRIAPEDPASRGNLEARLTIFAQAVAGASHVFSYRQIGFAGVVARKVQEGITPLILGLHRRTATLRMVLQALRPSLVLSAGNRDDDVSTGELCRSLGIPALLITHGSHVPPKTEPESQEWGEHGRRLIRAPYPYVAIQSPLAAQFLDVFPSPAARVITGPLTWSVGFDRSRVARLRGGTLLGRFPHARIIVHVGTTKPRYSIRFHVYETPDEYVQGIQDLAEAVHRLPDIILIIKFRPSQQLSAADLRALIPFSDRVLLSVDEPLGDVLGLADLVVSFSSTVIEEALQNSIPVLLYGGGGRYAHLPDAVDVAPGVSVPAAAAYRVARAEDLPDALTQILELHAGSLDREALFRRYRFMPEERVPVGQLLEALTSPARSS